MAECPLLKVGGIEQGIKPQGCFLFSPRMPTQAALTVAEPEPPPTIKKALLV
jgi:hypothetical protein